MLHWSQSHFLQALGWATLNSFWQMAVLWYAFVAAGRLFRLSAAARHSAAVSALGLGFCWAVATGFLYYQNASASYTFHGSDRLPSNTFLNVCLLSASVAYLLLLVFPAVRLYKSWRFVQTLKREPAQKAALAHRLFVKRIAFHLGIAKKVKLVVSALVPSPVTVGYLKPVILLPAAVLNNLSTAQVEAILLHELSHIRRYDYVLNFLVSAIHTLLYFNPFVKFFAASVENDREACCDETVLQFGYDKVGYASALLQLEKFSGSHKALALAAAGHRPLLTRIEKIVGMEKKKTFRLIQIVPLFFASLCLLFINSVLLVRDVQTGKGVVAANDAVFMPWRFEQNGMARKKAAVNQEETSAQNAAVAATVPTQIKIDIFNGGQTAPTAASSSVTPVTEGVIPVAYDEVDGQLTKEEKDTVKAAVEATKKVLSNLQWKVIETSLADVMNQREKAVIRQECQTEVDKMAWQNVEQNLKANYDRLNWEAVHQNMNAALARVRSDSLENVYATALTELQKAEKELKTLAKVKASPLPDCSLESLALAKQTLRKNLDSLKAAKPKKIVRL